MIPAKEKRQSAGSERLKAPAAGFGGDREDFRPAALRARAAFLGPEVARVGNGMAQAGKRVLQPGDAQGLGPHGGTSGRGAGVGGKADEVDPVAGLL